MTFYPPCNLQGSLVHGLRQVSGVWGESKKDQLIRGGTRALALRAASGPVHSPSPLAPALRRIYREVDIPPLLDGGHVGARLQLHEPLHLGQRLRTAGAEHAKTLVELSRSNRETGLLTFLRMRTADIFSIT
jgi:hypothetical protein